MVLQWIGLLQYVSGVTAVLLVLRYLFDYSWKQRSLSAWIALSAAAAAEVGVILWSSTDPEAADYAQEAMLLIGSTALPYLLLRCVRKRTFFLFGLAFCAATDYLVSFVPEQQSTAAAIVVDVLACVLALAASGTDRKAPPAILDGVPALVYLTVFTASLSAYYTGILYHDASYYTGVSVALRVLSLLLIGGCSVWFARRYFTAQRAEQAALKQLAVQLRYYEEIMEKNRQVRSLRHDYENNLLSIGAILDAGQAEDARDYVRQLQGEVHAASMPAATGNYFADVILFEKAGVAAEQNVQFSLSGTVPQKGIANLDLSTILCNLLDNAIQGCEPCAPCTVVIEGREAADRWLLTVKNPVAQKVIIRGGMIRTSKKDHENHGLGLANVRRAAEKYNGYLELNCDDRCFTAEVGLMLNTEDTK